MDYKPVAVAFVGGERSAEAVRWLIDNGIPAYDVQIALSAR